MNDLEKLASRLAMAVYGPNCWINSEDDGYVVRDVDDFDTTFPMGEAGTTLVKIIRFLVLKIRANHERDRLLLDEAAQALIGAEE